MSISDTIGSIPRIKPPEEMHRAQSAQAFLHRMAIEIQFSLREHARRGRDKGMQWITGLGQWRGGQNEIFSQRRFSSANIEGSGVLTRLNSVRISVGRHRKVTIHLLLSRSRQWKNRLT